MPYFNRSRANHLIIYLWNKSYLKPVFGIIRNIGQFYIIIGLDRGNPLPKTRESGQAYKGGVSYESMKKKDMQLRQPLYVTL
jgi:hypothetical protein